MTFLFNFVWGAKICLTGWSTYKACVGDNSNTYICLISASYISILVLATLCTCKKMPRPRQLDSLEGEYLQRLEEGLYSEFPNDKIE